MKKINEALFFFLRNTQWYQENEKYLLSQHHGNNGENKTVKEKKERNISMFVMVWRKIYFTIHNKKYMKILKC